MLAKRFARPGFRLAALLTMVVVAAACGSDSTEPEEEEPEVFSMRLTIGSTTKTITTASTDRSFAVARGANAVSVQWLKADGTVETIATTVDFTLRMVPATGTPITYTPASAQSFTGTLNVTGAVTNATVNVALFHVAEQHEDFGPIPITITAP
jgi:hypothetical protein